MSKRNLFIVAIVLVALAAITQWMTSSGNKKTDDLIDNSLVPKSLVGSFDEVLIKNNDSQVHLLEKDEPCRSNHDNIHYRRHVLSL